MEAAEHLTEDRAREHTAVRNASCRDDVENGRGRDSAERQQSARPDRRRHYSDVPQREHPVIIISAVMSQAASARAGVQWNAWNAAAFAQAHAAGRPILLSITTAWSAGCREMDRTTYADPGLISEIHEHFVPIRVDADERPDLAERYELGGVPTTAFLSPSGQLLGGGTFVDAERLRSVLKRVAPAVVHSVAAHVPARAGAATGDTIPSDSDLEDTVWALYDAQHGGFGDVPKFPHIAPVRLALVLHADRGDTRMLERATRTLDAMGWGALFDVESGGFYRCAGAADWTEPQRELLLTVNTSLLDLYLDAAEQTSVHRYYTRAAEITAFIETRLRRHDGAWRVSADVHASRVLTDVNARAASALLHAARVLDDAALGARAIEGLEHALLASYKPGDGVAHHAGGVRGLLTDHVAMMTATLDAWDETGNIVYRMMAEELARVSLRQLWDDHGGGFFDRAPSQFVDEPAAAAEMLKPFALNCEAATALRRLAAATDDVTFASRARDTLLAIASSAERQGPDAAYLLLARRAVLG
jgi:hypothetical protein